MAAVLPGGQQCALANLGLSAAALRAMVFLSAVYRDLKSFFVVVLAER